MKEKLIELFIQCLPAIIAAFSCIIASFKLLNGINNWKESINSTNLHNLSKDMKAVVKRNLELQEKIAILLNENEELKGRIENNVNSLFIEVENLKKSAEEKIEEEKEE